MDYLRKEKDDIVLKLKKIEDANEKLNKEVEKYEGLSTSNMLKIQDLESHLSEKVMALRDADAMRITEISNLSNTMKAKLDAKDAELNDMINVAKKELEKKSAEIETLKQSIHELERALKQEQQKYQAKEQEEREKQKREIEAQLEKANAVLSEEEMQWKDRFKILTDQYATIHDQNERLRQEMETLRDEKESLLKQFQIVKDRIQILKQKERDIEAKSLSAPGVDEDKRQKVLIKQLQSTIAQFEQDKHLYEVQSNTQKKMIDNLQHEVEKYATDFKKLKEYVMNASTTNDTDNLIFAMAGLLRFSPDEVSLLTKKSKPIVKSAAKPSSRSTTPNLTKSKQGGKTK